MKTVEEIVAGFKAIQATHKYATRNTYRKGLGVSTEKLLKLHKAGLIELPPPVPKSKCHLFSDQTKWRKFRLNGSPTRRT